MFCQFFKHKETLICNSVAGRDMRLKSDPQFCALTEGESCCGHCPHGRTQEV